MAWFAHGTSRIWLEEAGQGDPVLLLPGFTDSIAGHRALRDKLAERFRVIAADLPGSGRSGPQPRQYHPGYYREDAQAMLALLTALGAAPAHVLGFSDGGEVAINMAALAPVQIRSVLTWGASGVIQDPEGEVLDIFRKVLDAPLPGFEGYRTYLLRAYGAEIARATLDSFVAAAEAMIAAGGDLGYAAADRIACPVLLLKGEGDVLVQAEAVKALAERIRKGRMELVPGAGHGVHDDQPAWFQARVSDWLAGV